jgi:serine/threonine-protein kinase SRPK3
VALKIASAETTAQSREVDTLKALKEHAKEIRGSDRIVRMLDDFLHEGPNGCHQCLVFELLGPKINIELDGDRRPREIFKIIISLLKSVAFIHEAGYAHGSMYLYWNLWHFLDLL